MTPDPQVLADLTRPEMQAQSAQEYRLLLENITDYAIILMDARGVVTTWNVGAERLLGYAEGEILGRPAALIFTPEDRAAGGDAQEMATAAQQGRAQDERWHLRRDGTRFWGSGILTALRDDAGRLTGYAKILRDLTASHEADEAQRRAREYAEDIVDTVREAMLVLDPGLDVVSANRSFYRMFEVAPEETVGRRVYDLGSGQWDIPALRTLLEEIIPSGSAFNDYEVEHVFPGLGRKVMLLNARKVYRPGNHTDTLLLAMEDITERKDALGRLQVELKKQQRIADALQRPLLVETPEDAFPGLQVATLYSATWEEARVGGDFFDVYALADNRVVLLVGDVTGKGLAAATRATEAKDVMRAFLRLYPYYPATAMTRLNDYYCEAQALDDRGADTILAMSMALVDLKTSEATFAWAGSEPPLVIRAHGAVEPLVGGGMLLGVKEHTTFSEITVSFRPGDTFLLSTDGLSEARQGKEFLGQEGVIELAQEALKAPTLRAMGQAILDGARRYAGGHLQDDACLALARFPARRARP